ncbi:hypothetical protein [Deinococcus ruber]|uniref:family 4 glycosyl hydrolase n=1 Tax=Deinococcus ruber TaxID=1848197 RepID=UPI0027E554AB|nr:hypothetical protein [Deinococcus ruber]
MPCLVDRQGVQPTRIGHLPPQLAALTQTNINMQALTVEALVTDNSEHVYHAAQRGVHNRLPILQHFEEQTCQFQRPAHEPRLQRRTRCAC